MNESRGDHRPDRVPAPGPAYFAERVPLTLHERRAIDRLELFMASDDPAFAAQFGAGAGVPHDERRRWRFWRRG